MGNSGYFQHNLDGTEAGLLEAGRVLSLLSAFEYVPESEYDIADFYIGRPEKTKHRVFSVVGHKNKAQEAWLALLNSGLDKEVRQEILRLVAHRIAPWFNKPELLMDFLTDSYNFGGSTSLLALSGLFYLMQEKNLDYPLFYPKLYSLLDSRILHSR